MKKLICSFLLIFSLLIMFDVNALCYDEELNEWAVDVNVSFKEDKRFVPMGENSSENDEFFAYFLSVSPIRDDIIIKVTDGSGNIAEGKSYNIDLDNDGKKEDEYGVGCYNNLDDETYIIEIYGKENSACPNELLKTLKYTVPQYNDYIKSEYCENYPDHELCQTYTNKTKSMTETEFNDILDKYDKEIKGKELTSSKIFKIIVEYGIYILIPLALVSIYYIIKIVKLKKEERNR